MSPIDHELRTALRSRAHDLSPSPDVLAGVERRAGRLRRNRALAAVAGSALALSAIAVVVPGLASTTRTDPGPLATSAPTSAPVPGRPANAVDWPSTPLDLTAQGDRAYLDEYAVAQGRDDRPQGEVLLSGGVPGQATVKVYQLWYDGGPARAVVMQESEGGPVLLRDTETTPDLPVIDAVVRGGGGPDGEALAHSGDEVPYVVVVAPPGTAAVQYAADGRTFDASWSDRTALVPRLGPSDVERRDELRLLDADGRTTYQGPVWLGVAEGQDGEVGEEGPRPDNQLDWPARGSAPTDLQEQALNAFAATVGATREGVRGQPIYGGTDGTGRPFVLMQVWELGQDARTFTLVADADGRPVTTELGPFLDKGPAVLAVLVEGGAGAAGDLLAVVGEPITGQVLYSADGSSDPRPAGRQDDGVWLIDRQPGTTGDRLLVLDGDGDLDRPIYRGAVAPLLCGLERC